jgi:hypothetical protein
MPAAQPNWNYFTYVSDDGTTYNIRAEAGWAGVAAHGLAARTNGAPRFMATKNKRPRRVIYRDATTFRTRSGPIGTAAGYGAIAEGDAQAFAIQGEAATVVYNVVKKVPEKVPTSTVGPQLVDHA